MSFKSTLSEICVFVLLDVLWDTLRDRQDKVHCSQFTHLPSIHPFIPKVRVHYRHEVDAQVIIVLIGAELTQTCPDAVSLCPGLLEPTINGECGGDRGRKQRLDN